jgi:signal transduction histidine kinase
MRLRTLRGRLTALALLAATVAVALMVIGFNVVLARVLDGDIDQRLRSRAAAAATTVRVSDGTLTLRESPDDAAIDARVWAFDGTREVVRPPAAVAVQRAARALAGQDGVYREIDDPETRLYAQRVTADGRQVGTIVVAESMAAYDRTTDLALVGTVILAGLLLAAVFATTWVIVGRALAPVTEMTRSAAQWSAHEPGRRFGAQSRADELGELAGTFDDLLDRVAASLRHEQRLTAELSHELRTPLARIAAEMELLQRRERSPEDRREAYEVVDRSTAQMGRILEALMAAARAEAHLGRGRSELAEAFDELEAQWMSTARERGLELELDAAGQTVGADAEVVERIVAPLLDNAMRHAGSWIAVEAVAADGHVRVVVRDDGPGIRADRRESVFEPGVGSEADGHDGAGLGLALSRRLARAAGGDVTVADSDGGTTFVVALPV